MRCGAKNLWKSAGSVGVKLSAQCAKEQAGCFYSPTDLSDKHRCHADYLSITQIAPSARQIDTDFSQAESNMYGSMPHDGACLDFVILEEWGLFGF